MRAATASARFHASSRCAAVTTSQSTGAMPTNRSDDALVLPIRRITSANSAGSRHPPRRAARIVRPISHGRPAHGSSSTEIRAVNASWYGVSTYTIAPTSAPARFVPSIVNSQSAPAAAANEIEPRNRRCATQSGTPSWSMTQ